MSENDALINLISKTNAVSSDCILLHNGAADLLQMIVHALTKEDDYILLPSLGWSYYYALAEQNKLHYYTYSVTKKDDTFTFALDNLSHYINAKIVFITSPNMPTGNAVNTEEIISVAHQLSNSLIIVDQVYYEFSRKKIDINKILNKCPNILFLRSFSKYYALANLRIGYCITSPSIKSFLSGFEPLFKISHLSRKVAYAALKDATYYDKIREKIIESREKLYTYINQNTLMKAYKSEANFLYVFTGIYSAQKLQDYLEKNGFRIRRFDSDQFVRISIGEENAMEQFLDALQKFILSTNAL